MRTATVKSGRFLKRMAAKGTTLVELAMVIGVIGVLSGVAVLALRDNEARDADMIMSVHASLQNIVNQASVRLDVSPSVLVTNATNANLVRLALEDHLNQDTTGVVVTNAGGTFTITMDSTGRTATYTVPTAGVNTGRVVITSVNPAFNNYSVIGDGTLRKN